MNRNFKFTLGFIGFLWLVFFIDQILPINLLNLGISPRSVHGLFGILFAPFLHLNLEHLFGNSIVLISLLFVSLGYDFSNTWKAMAVIMIVSGLGQWGFGDYGVVHLGASVFTYGLLAFLLFTGFFRHNFSSIVETCVVVLIFGDVLWTFLSIEPGVSWSGHFFGFVGGIIAAKMLKISQPDKTFSQ